MKKLFSFINSLPLSYTLSSFIWLVFIILIGTTLSVSLKSHVKSIQMSHTQDNFRARLLALKGELAHKQELINQFFMQYPSLKENIFNTFSKKKNAPVSNSLTKSLVDVKKMDPSLDEVFLFYPERSLSFKLTSVLEWKAVDQNDLPVSPLTETFFQSKWRFSKSDPNHLYFVLELGEKSNTPSAKMFLIFVYDFSEFFGKEFLTHTSNTPEYFLMNSQREYLALPSPSNAEINRLEKFWHLIPSPAILSNRKGFKLLKLEHSKYYFAIKPIVDGGFYLGLVVPEKYLFASIAWVKWLWISFFLMGLIPPIIVYLILHKSFLHPLNHSLKSINDVHQAQNKIQFSSYQFPVIRKTVIMLQKLKAENSDLKTKLNTSLTEISEMLETLKRNNDTTEAFSENQDEWDKNSFEFINNLTKSFDKLRLSSKRQSDSLLEISQALNQINGTIQNMVEQQQQLSNSIDSTSAAIEQMTVSIENLSAMADNLNQIAGGTYKQTEEGQNQINELMEEIEGIQRQVTRNAEVIKGLHSRAIRISEITQVIDEIADQTNLLALNAAIEAARAGDAGKGFAVVAEEIRKLAEKTTNATKEIAQMITNIQDSATLAVEAMGQEQKLVNDSEKRATQIVGAFKRIAQEMNNVNSLVFNVDSSLQEQTLAAHQILKSVQEMRESSNKFTDLSQTQATALDEIKTTIEEIVKFSQSISETIRKETGNIETTLNRFRQLMEMIESNRRKFQENSFLLASALRKIAYLNQFLNKNGQKEKPENSKKTSTITDKNSIINKISLNIL